MDKVNFYQSKKFLALPVGISAILITLEFFEEFFIQNPNAIYVIIPAITLLSIVYSLVEASVDNTRTKNGGNNDRQPKS